MTPSMSRRNVLRTAAAALALRPPSAAATEHARMLDQLLARRRMVRRFAPDRIPTATIRRLVGAAVRAPSAGHTQPWEFVVVRAERTRRMLAQAAAGQRFVADAPVVVVACFDVSRATPRYGEHAELYGIIDTAFASLCLLLAVAEEGLGACFVGAIDRPRVAQILGLPPHGRVLAVIPIGRPAESPRSMRIRRPREVLHRERW